MTKPDLREIPTLYLLVELMKNGRAGTIEALVTFEPIAMDVLLQSLHERTGMTLGTDFDHWYDWYMSDASPASKSERETLSMIKSMKERDEHFKTRFLNRKRNVSDDQEDEN